VFYKINKLCDFKVSEPRSNLLSAVLIV